jgi:type IV pilus assembly protein PilY1
MSAQQGRSENEYNVRRLISACALSAMLLAQNAQAFTISQSPPFLPTPPPSNLIISFDDSGSMRWAYAPDGICGQGSSRRVKSAAYNPLYYDPGVRYPAPTNASGTALTTSFTDAYVNGFDPSRGSRDLSNNYQVSWSYNPAGDVTSTTFDQCTVSTSFASNPAADYTSSQLQAGVAAYYYVYNPSGTSCSPAATTNDACYQRRIVSSTSGPATADINGDGLITSSDQDERQNFANWYSFYRTRNLATVSAASSAFYNLPSGIRVAWQALNSCNRSFTDSSGYYCRGWNVTSGSGVNNRIRTYDNTHRSNFYSWLQHLPASGGTPLRSAITRAGDYYGTKTADHGTNTPYAETPQVTAGTELSCRPNFHILMTDGIWNDATAGFCAGSTCGNYDGTARTLPDNRPYSTSDAATAIYRDSNSDSLSDVAFYYWANDLREDLPNKQIPYTADRTGNADQQYWNPKNDHANWQHMVTFTVGLGLSSVMNLTSPDRRWMGTTYGPGGGYPNFLSGAATWPATGANQSPGNVYDLWHAAINSRGQAFAADNPQQLTGALTAAVNRIAAVESAAAVVTANATRLQTDAAIYQARFNTADWAGYLTAYQLNTDGSLGSKLWDATDAGNIPSAGSRNIVTWSGSAGIDFTQTSLTSAGLWSYINSADLLAYLRGDQSKEVANGGTYRNRGTRLGDVVNSDPAYVAAANWGYSTLPEGKPSASAPYLSFVTSNKSRRKMVYVGANDGMLHGFDATTGAERFAFVPRAALPNLAALASPTYAHRYLVDGGVVAYDAYWSGSWKTVVLGSAGAGGRSLFALDVTNPDSFGPSKVLWEINDATAQRAGDSTDPQYSQLLGSTLGVADVVRLNNGDWAAVFGNGYRSASERAALYVVRISDGTLIKKFDTGIGDATNPNGLGSPTLYDVDGDEVYDYAYAADMRGNVWKFDLRSASTSNWQIAFNSSTGFPNGSPLFQARSPSGAVQPISSRLELAAPPSGVAGIVVLFGTGRFFAQGDKTDTTTQTFYGIVDRGARIASTNRSTLQQQTITESGSGRTVSTNTVNWGSRDGWYMDLPTSGERVIGRAIVRSERVLFTTVIPTNDPCDQGGTSWLMQIDARTGAALPYTIFDTNGDGVVDASDQALSGIQSNVGMVPDPAALQGLALLSGTSGRIQSVLLRRFGRFGRDSWNEVKE